MSFRFAYLLLVIFISTSNYVCSSQSEDELIKTLIDSIKESKEKATVYNLISGKLINIDPQLALVYADSALQKGNSDHDYKNIYKALFFAGEANFELGLYETTISNFMEALKYEGKLENDTLVGDTYYSLGAAYSALNNHEMAITYYRNALVYYEKLNEGDDILQTYYQVSSTYHDMEDYEASLQNYFYALNLSKNYSAPESVANLYNGLGVLYTDLGSYEKALSYYMGALEIFKEKDNNNGISTALNNIGIVYYDWGNIDKALEYYQKSLRIEQKYGGPLGVAGSFNNIGIIYSEWDQHELAIDYYNRSLELYQIHNDPIGISYAVNNLGECYAKMGDYEKAIDLLNRSLDIELAQGTKRGAAQSYHAISEAYLLMGNFKKALEFNNKNFHIADSLNLMQLLMLSKKQYYNIYKRLNSYKKALAYYEGYETLKDSIYNTNFQRKITDLQITFEFDQKQKDKEQQKLNNTIRNKEKQVQRTYLVIVFVLLILFGILIYYEIRSKNKTNQQLKESNLLLQAEKEKLSNALGHISKYEQKYHNLIRYSPSGILYMDRTGKILESNDKMLNIIGLRNDSSSDEINCFTYAPMKSLGFSEDLKKCLDSGKVIYNEVHYVTKWGKSVFLKYYLTPISDDGQNITNIIANVEDITATLEAAKSRRESELKYRMLVENSLQAMLIIQDAKVIFANPRMEELSQFSFDELAEKGRQWIDMLIHPSDKKRSMKNVRDALNGKDVGSKQVYKIIRKDSNVRIMETISSVVDFKGKPAMLVVAIDDTDRKNAETHLIESEKQLMNANAMKDKFFSIIAHDLKNPFSSIVGLSNLLHEAYGNFSEKQRKDFIKNICESSENTFKLLQNLLEWSRTQTGNIEFCPELIDINKVINENLTILKSGFLNKKIEVKSMIPENTKAFADENMVKVIVRNLLSNALKFTDEGGKITVSAFTKENEVEIYIEDDGVGISEDNLDKLFRIDGHLKLVGTANEEGTGLGLILCKEFVTKNNGKISIQSEIGIGSRFSFTLPIEEIASKI